MTPTTAIRSRPGATAVGVDGTTPVSGSFTYTYYVGGDTSGTSLGSTAPTNADTYTVVASFTSMDSNYTNASSQTTFTISKAPTQLNRTTPRPMAGRPTWRPTCPRPSTPASTARP